MARVEAEADRHAIVEQLIADAKDSALAHLPSGRFATWLALAAIVRNLRPTTCPGAGPGNKLSPTSSTPCAPPPEVA